MHFELPLKVFATCRLPTSQKYKLINVMYVPSAATSSVTNIWDLVACKYDTYFNYLCILRIFIRDTWISCELVSVDSSYS